MKTVLTCFLLASFAASCFADDAPKQATKISKGALNVEAEIEAFYTRLTTDDADVQKQVQALTATEQERYGGTYHVYPPQVVAWFPSQFGA